VLRGAKRAAARRLRAEAWRHPAARPPARARSVFGGLNPPGLSSSDNAANQGPPDTTGAIGPSNYVEIVNSRVAVYSRSLGLVASTGLDTLAGISPGTSDPQIEWDPRGGRWFYVVNDGTTALAFGWSKSADPSDLVNGWCRFSLSTPLFDDFPKLGHDDTHLIIGANAFSGATAVTAQIIVVPKPASGATTCPSTPPSATVFGSALTPLTNADGSPAFTPVPANTFDASGTGYVVAAHDPGSGAASKVMAWHIGDASGTPTLVADGDTTVPSYSVPANVPQPGTSNTLDSSDVRLTQAVAEADPGASGAEAVWTQHTVSGGAGSVVRWYELLPAGLTALQAGTVSNPANFVFNGAISPAGNGDAALNYNVGGSSQLVQIRSQARQAADPLSSTGGETLLGTSTGIDQDASCSPPPCRWGDYAGASPDPADSSLIWGSNQLNGPPSGGSFAWTTRNFAVSTLPGPNDPTARFTATPSGPVTAQPVSFDANASTSPNGPIAAYSWSFGDGASATGATASHPFARAGTYTVTLRVTDSTSSSSTTTKRVTVGDRPPVAVLSLSRSSALTGEPIAFDGSGSSDPDGSVTSYRWSFGDGADATGPAPQHAYAHAGTYTVTMAVFDDSGSTATASRTVTIIDRPPVAVLRGPGAATIAGDPVGFDASGSSDPDGSIAGYAWDFGDGATATGPTVTHSFARSGSYTVRVTVVDDSGSTASVTQQVSVRAPPRPARCLVPDLRGQTLDRARRSIRDARCRSGRTRRSRSSRGRPSRELVVVSQRPRAGTSRRANSRVSVTVRPARR
jgi:PKD repeat protein